ncbi:MAG: ABC transporter ATP-binding protein, partial [Oscillospiraceae bacterium]|nr:ABC transporter ATP-binding protein [Oscillospiraceae bacterium]
MKNRTLKWLYEVPGRKRVYVLILALMHALLGVAGVVYAMLMRGIVDSASAGNSAAFWRYVATVISVVLAQLGVNAINRWLNERFRSGIENIFKQRLFREILNRDYARVSAVHSGEWLNRLTNDTSVVANAYTEILPGLTGMLIRLVSALVMIVALDSRFAAILLPAGGAVLVMAALFRKKLKTLHRVVQEMDGRLRVFFQERIGNLLVLHAFVAEKLAEREAAENMEAHWQARMQKNRFSNVCNVGFGAAMNAMYFFGVIYCGYGMLKGRISFGTLTALTMLISQIQSPFANISAYLPGYYTMLASAERLMDIEELEMDRRTPLLETAAAAELYRNRLESFGLDRVSFAYGPAAGDGAETDEEGRTAALENLSLDIRKGETVAFTGHSGCGKSTALKLLMCIYPPDAGSRYLRFTDGSRQELDARFRRLFAYVPQGNALMRGTLRE